MKLKINLKQIFPLKLPFKYFKFRINNHNCIAYKSKKRIEKKKKKKNINQIFYRNQKKNLNSNSNSFTFYECSSASIYCQTNEMMRLANEVDDGDVGEMQQMVMMTATTFTITTTINVLLSIKLN